MGVLIRRRLAAAMTVTMLLAAGGHLHAQRASAPELTAAFLLNFVKFTVWPAAVLPERAPIVACLVGDDRVAEALDSLAKGQTIGGRAVAVQRIALADPVAGCHLLYGGRLNDRQIGSLIHTTAGQPILTVSDVSNFAERGGTANLFVEAGKMRFAVNPAAAERAGLRISSRLLTLAKIVSTVPDTTKD